MLTGLLGRKKYQGVLAVCPECGVSKKTKTKSYFIMISLRRQLEYFLSVPLVTSFVWYRETRTKRSNDALEDIMDGARYKKIRVDGKELMGSDKFSFHLNTDG